MDFNADIRKKQLDNLDQLISSSRERIESVLHYLGWKVENVDKDEVSNIQCPFNPHHKIPPKSWNKHLTTCSIKSEGYSLNDQFLGESLQDPSQSIFLDRNKKIEIITKELQEKGPLKLDKYIYYCNNFIDEVIVTQLNPESIIILGYIFMYLAWNGIEAIPRTADRLTSTFSSDERLAFYNYSVQNTVGPSAPPEFTTLVRRNPNDNKLPSTADLLSQERDAKRRPTRYKSVHLNHKNHTEVIKEVIDNQMEEYKEWLQRNGSNSEKTQEERPHSSISRTSGHSGGSRRSSGKPDNRRRSRDRRRDSRSRHVSPKRREFDKSDKGRRRDSERHNGSGRSNGRSSRGSSRERSRHREYSDKRR